jgi:hypothetical protein
MIWDEHAYLMVDFNLIEEERNTSLVRERAFKRDDVNPIITARQKNLSFNGRAHSFPILLVVREGGVFRAWIDVRLHQPGTHFPHRQTFTGYAESPDGIHWKPVMLNQVEWNGSRRNNLIDWGSQKVGWPFHDPLDRAYPFKCVYYRPGTGRDIAPGIQARWPWVRDKAFHFVWGIGRSRDGLVWEPPRHPNLLIAENPENARLHRTLDGGLVISDQMTSPFAEACCRNVRGWITYDEAQAHLLPDPLFSVPEGYARLSPAFGHPPHMTGRWIQPHIGLVAARKGPTILALHGYLYNCTDVETYAQSADIGLSVSSNGIWFREVWPFRPFIACGPRGAFDDGMVAQCCMLENGDETWFYHAGGHGNFATPYLPGIAWIPRDRFGYRLIRGYRNLEKRESTAGFTLKPCVLPDKAAFSVNVSHVTGTRTVRMELAREDGKPIPGYAFKDCVPVTEEGLRQPVAWRKNRRGSELGGRTVKIRIALSSPDCGEVGFDSPRLYAVYTRP